MIEPTIEKLNDAVSYERLQAMPPHIAKLTLDGAITPDKMAPMLTLGGADLHLIREWFDGMQDLNRAYLEPKDYILAKRIYEAVGMRVPHSVLEGAGIATPGESA